MASIDQHGNFHRGKGEGGGRFTEKHNARPSTTIPTRAAEPADITAVRFGARGPRAALLLSISGGNAVITAPRERADEVVELARAAASANDRAARVFDPAVDTAPRETIMRGLLAGQMVIVKNPDSLSHALQNELTAWANAPEYGQLVLVRPTPAGGGRGRDAASRILTDSSAGIHITFGDAIEPDTDGVTNEDLYAKVAARGRGNTARRLAPLGVANWAQVPRSAFRPQQALYPGKDASASADAAFEAGRLSLRAYHQVIRSAWALASTEGDGSLAARHVHDAMTLMTPPRRRDSASLPEAERAYLAGLKRPISWDDMGSSERDIWEERQLRARDRART